MTKTDALTLLSKALDEGNFDSGQLGSGNQTIDVQPFVQVLEGLAEQGLLSGRASLLSVLEDSTLDVAVPSPAINRLHLVDLLYKNLEQDSRFDPMAMPILYELRPVLLRLMFDSLDFVKSSRHPVREALDDLAGWLFGLDASLGKPGEKLTVLLQDYAKEINRFDMASGVFPEPAQEKLVEIRKTFERYEKLEQRICESERSTMETLRCSRIVDNFLNEVSTEKGLPSDVILFLQDVWRSSLRMLLIRHGRDSNEWATAKRVTSNLVFTFTPQTLEEARQKVYKLIPTLRDKIAEYLISIRDDELREEWLNKIENLHMEVLKGEAVDLEPIPGFTSIETEGVVTSISHAVSEEAISIKTGQWLIYRKEEGTKVRIKMALLLGETAQMIFVNLLGAKVLEKGVEEIGYALTSKKASVVNTSKLFTEVLTKTLEQFIRKFFRQEKVVRASVTEDEELKKNSLEKAREEARRLRDMRKTGSFEAVTVSEEELAHIAGTSDSPPSMEKPEVQSQVDSLTLGSWLEIENHQGARVPCKVAVVYNSTGKLVLVNETGIKVGEFFKDNIVEMIMSNQAKVLEKTDNFENSLARVIKTLRKD